MTQVQSNNGVRHEITKNPITLDSISVSKFQKEGTKTAQLRQVIITQSFYPSKKVSNSMNANFFDTSDFGFEEQTYKQTENRMAFMDVPVNATEEQIKARLDKANEQGACIYKILSSTPILDEDQRYAIENGVRTMEDFANSQVVRYPKDAKDTQGNLVGGQIIVDDNGKVSYRRTFLSLTPIEDADNRGGSDYFVSSTIEAELKGASVLAGQTY